MADEPASPVAQGAPRPERVFVGRGDALSILQSAFDACSQGHGRVVLLSGEPGIGKTRCAEQFTGLAEDQGALVLWGRCFEQPGAPPYWPWVQILRGYADASSHDELRMLMGSGSDSIAALVPEIGARLGVAPRGSAVADNQRFYVFDAVGQVLARAAATVPQLLVIDDLHWADASSLSLLEFLCREARRQRVLIVCAYRDTEVTRKSPLVTTLGGLTQSGGVERVRLSGLSQEETGELTRVASGLRLPARVLHAVFQQTDGNPLFVNEVAKVIADEHRSSGGDLIAVDVPDGVREAIGRRLDGLSPTCNRLLGAASVAGREFDLALIAKVMDLPLSQCLAEIDGAALAGIVAPHAGSAVTHRFTHALIREALYDELPTLEQLNLHDRIARALMELHGGDLDPVLSELVHHFGESSALGDYETAVELALRAAARDERMYAFEEACRHYDQAARILIANGRSDDPRAAQAYLRKGIGAHFAGRFQQGIESLTEGIGLARRQGDPGLFTAFAIRLISTASFGAQIHGAPLLQEALELLPAHDSTLRALALAHFAFALREKGDPAEVARVGAEAIAMARRQDDGPTLCNVLRFVVMGLRGWAHTLSQRLSYGEEMVALNAARDNFEEAAESCYWHLLDLLEAGDVTAFRRLLGVYAQRAREYQFPRHEYQVSLLEIVLALMQGEWSEAEQAIERAYDQNRKHAQDAFATGEGVYGAQMFVLNRELGRLRMLGPLVQRLIDGGESRLWEPGLVLICCETGLADQARHTLDKLATDDFGLLRRDDLWCVCIAFCAEASARLGDVGRARVLYDLLLPYAGQTVSYPGAACFGAASAYLGMLAQTLGRFDAAREHFQSAAEMNRSMGAWPALVRTQVWLGRLLLSSQSGADVSVGRRLLAEAEQLAVRFAMAGLTAEISELLDASVCPLPDNLTAREAEVLKLLAMGRSNKDVSKVLAISLSTVATHVRSILTKTGCANRTEAAAYANRHDLT